MCPSFQATREEKHSTRGRANLLRMAITGQLDFEGFTDPHLHDVLDLCLECKGCKSECPTNVDMARIKAEFLHQYYRRRGVPRRNWLFGHIAKTARIGCAVAPMSSWISRSLPTHWLLEKLLRIDRRRMPPAFARRTLRQRFSSRDDFNQLEPADRRVLLFPDTFTNYYEPEVGAAAIGLLDRVGITPTFGPPDLRCCGRPLISNGLLDEAVAHAQHNVELLFDWVHRGGVITACEPSCVLTIRDDYPARPGRFESARSDDRAVLPDIRGMPHFCVRSRSIWRVTVWCRPAKASLRTSTLPPAFAGRDRADAQAAATGSQHRGH